MYFWVLPGAQLYFNGAPDNNNNKEKGKGNISEAILLVWRQNQVISK